METISESPAQASWNKGKIVGQKARGRVYCGKESAIGAITSRTTRYQAAMRSLK